MLNSDQFLPTQICYKPLSSHEPRYKYVKILLSNISGNSFVPTATGTTQIQFKMPYNTVFNLARSKLAYQIQVPAQGSGNYSWITSDCFNLGNQLITFETGNGLQLLNLMEPQKYSAIVGKVNYKQKEFLTNDETEKPFSNAVASTTGASPVVNPTCQNITANQCPNIEPQYLQVSGANAALNDSNFFKLGNFAHTILGLDKDLYFGQNDMYLKITTGGYNQFTWQGTGATNPTTNAQTLTTAVTAISNIYLYLAVEQNPVIIDNVVKHFNSNEGIRISIDFPWVNKLTTTTGTSSSVVVNYPPAYGKFLKKIYHTVWNPTESLATLMDCNNTNGAKVVSYNTYLDSTKLQDDVLSCAAPAAGAIGLDDWRTNEQECKNSPIFGYGIYQKNWFHCDDFTLKDVKSDDQTPLVQNIQYVGLPMERAVQWTFTATTANASFIYDTFAIFTRELSISKDGVQFVGGQ